MKQRQPQGDKRQRPQRGPDDPRYQVFGLYLVARMGDVSESPCAVQCPAGHPVQYGTVVSRGDGFDAQACAFRGMPRVGAVVAFEEPPEGIEGHYFFADDQEYRILHLDALTMAFPPEVP